MLEPRRGRLLRTKIPGGLEKKLDKKLDKKLVKVLNLMGVRVYIQKKQG